MPNECVLVIPDTHHPFEHADALSFLKALKRSVGPTKIVHLGDEADMHAFSTSFAPDPDGFSPGKELEETVKHLKPWYREFPRALVCHSNHTSRPFRKAFQFGLPQKLFRTYREFLEAPMGWDWADHHVIDGVYYEHGEGASGQNGAIRIALQSMRSTVIGHIHAFAGISWAANTRHLVYGFNVGCLIDKDKYAFAYGKNLRHKPILGAGIVERGVPRYYPMKLDSHGRWTGRL